MHLIIDGNNLLYRIFWVIRGKNPPQHDHDLTEGLLNSIKTLCAQFEPDNIWCSWDRRLDRYATNFRTEHKEVKYKAGRDKSEMADAFAKMDEFIAVFHLLGIKQIFPRRLEADDVIAWLSKKLDDTVVIVSPDKDMFQLISHDVKVYNPLKKLTINGKNFEKTVEVPQRLYLQFRAITGDTSDNIKGVGGYQLKKFKKFLLTEEGNLCLDPLTDDQKDIYERNLELMDLTRGYEIEDGEIESYQKQYDQVKGHKSDLPGFFQVAKKWDLRTVLLNQGLWADVFKDKKKFSSDIDNLMTRFSHGKNNNGVAS